MYQLIVAKWDPSDGAWERTRTAGLDTLIALEDAPWTPELRDGDGIAIFSTAQLRAATKAAPPHRLKAMRPGHAIYTTRRYLIEWRESWHAPSSPQDLCSIESDKSGLSLTTSMASAISEEHDTALRLAQRLKKSSPSTSRSRRA